MQLPAVVWGLLFYRGLVVDGETGYVVAPNDFPGMTDRNVALLDDPQGRRGDWSKRTCLA